MRGAGKYSHIYKHRNRKKFLWKEYGTTWVVKEIKKCEYTLRKYASDLIIKLGYTLDYYNNKNGYKEA